MKSTTPGEIRIFLLATLLLTTATIANAQQPAKLPRIGVLLALSHSAFADRIEASARVSAISAIWKERISHSTTNMPMENSIVCPTSLPN
jgi:hypothetical protein